MGGKPNELPQTHRTLPRTARSLAPLSVPVRSGISVGPKSKNVVPQKISGDKQPLSVVSDCEGGAKTEKPTDTAFIDLVGKTLVNCVWYHGLIPRTECECMLKSDGDFVVRRTTLKKSSTYCLSVMHGSPKHFPVDYKKGAWVLYKVSSPTLPELIATLLKSATSIGTSGAVLRNAIPRPDYYLLHENIKIDKKLGAGAFGEVYTGILKQKDGDVPVAVKRIKGQVEKAKLTEFVKEAKLMRRFCHPNCVRLWGVAPQEEPLMIVLELCPNGSLKTWFKENKETKNMGKQLLSFMQDAARGMCYLSKCNVIHRDLAARNCLLGKNNELKISDFGLSVADKSELVLDRLKSVPVKWLSPETLTRGIFNSKTDVWSYGVLVWEIYNKCKTDPFPTLTNAQAKLAILAEGAPLSAPPDSPPVVQEVMNLCFVKNPQNRADFVQILKALLPDEAPPSNDPPCSD